jgi:hypothetical protein
MHHHELKEINYELCAQERTDNAQSTQNGDRGVLSIVYAHLPTSLCSRQPLRVSPDVNTFALASHDHTVRRVVRMVPGCE